MIKLMLIRTGATAAEASLKRPRWWLAFPATASAVVMLSLL